MTQLYGYRWEKAYGTCDNDNTWLDCLQGVRPEQIRAGLSVIVRNGSDWPPSAPEFRKVCLEATLIALNLPDPDVAFLEACRNSHAPSRAKWSHQGVYVAGMQTGWFDLKGTAGRDRVEKVFMRNYEIVCRRIAAGESLEADIPKALEDTREKPRALTERDKEAGQVHLNNLKDLFK